MGRPYILKLTDQEKADLQHMALAYNMSVEEFVNYMLTELLINDKTGVYNAMDEYGDGEPKLAGDCE